MRRNTTTTSYPMTAAASYKRKKKTWKENMGLTNTMKKKENKGQKK